MSSRGAALSDGEFEARLAEWILRLESVGFDRALEELEAQELEHGTALRERLIELREFGLLAPMQCGGAVDKAFGGYSLRRRVGGGGMGVVYEARAASGERVALKTLPPYLCDDGRAKRRFRQEIRAIERLRHPGIVPVLESGEARGIPFFAMEFIEGKTLAQIVEQLRATRIEPGDLRGSDLAPSFGCAADDDPVAVVCRVFANLADALSSAHASGVLHRDVKPSNVLIDAAFQPRLFDFGLAHVVDSQRMTKTGEFVGTPLYVSPEQAVGGDVDARTDVYGLGITLYELLTLTVPYSGSDARILHQVVHRELPSPRLFHAKLPKDLVTICQAAIAKQPWQRYGSAQAMADDLRRFLQREPVHARPLTLWQRTLRRVRRRPLVAALIAALVAAGIGLALFEYELGRRQEHAARLARFAENVLLGADFEELGRDAHAVDLLLRAVEILPEELRDYPFDHGRLLMKIASVLAGLGMHDVALRHLERARELLEGSVGPGHADVGRVWNFLGNERQFLGRGDPAVAYRHAIRCSREAKDGEYPVYVLNLCGWLRRQGRGEEARRLLEELLREDLELAAELRFNIQIEAGWLAHYTRRFDVAGRHALRSLELAERGSQRAKAHELASFAAVGSRELEVAAEHARKRCVEIERLFRAETVQVAAARYVEGVLAWEQRDPGRAAAILRGALDLSQRALPEQPAHPWNAAIEMMLGVALAYDGQFDVASQHLEHGLAIQREHPEQHTGVRLRALTAKAVVAAGLRRPHAEIAAAFRLADQAYQRRFGERAPERSESLEAEAEWRAAVGTTPELERAAGLLATAQRLFDDARHDDRFARVLARRAELLAELGRPDEAARLRAEVGRAGR